MRALGALVAAVVATSGLVAVAPVATARPATSISIRVLKTSVTPGGSGFVVGNLSIDGRTASGRSVALEAREQGESTFTPIGAALADKDGDLRMRVTPGVATRYRWRYDGAEDAQPRLSGVATIRIRKTDRPPRRRATTLSARSVAGVVSAGGQDVVQGTLRVGRSRLAHRYVVLLVKPVGQVGWRFRTGRKTNGRARVQFAVRPATTTAYRIAFAGTSRLRPVWSPVVSVDVRPDLTLTADPTEVATGESTTLSGAVVRAESPIAGATVDLLASTGAPPGAWTRLSTTTSAADGTVSFVVTPAATTRFRLRVRPAGGLPRAFSPVVTVEVQAP